MMIESRYGENEKPQADDPRFYRRAVLRPRGSSAPLAWRVVPPWNRAGERAWQYRLTGSFVQTRAAIAMKAWHDMRAQVVKAANGDGDLSKLTTQQKPTEEAMEGA